MRFIDMQGQKIGRLTVGEPIRGGHEVKWRCTCECGTNLEVVGHLLRSGDTRSCGCLRKEVTATLGRSLATHRMRDLPEYGIWSSMKNRCTNPGNPNFVSWGGRGIEVCKRWQFFENFYADMGPRPSPKHSIDRINNDGHYEPSNCRWGTPDQQNSNRRTSRIIEFRGRRQSLAQWAREIGLKPQALFMRLRVWDVERALTTPKKGTA